MFDNVGKTLDPEAGRRTVASVLITVLLTGLTAGGVTAYMAYKAAQVIVQTITDFDQEMVEVELDDLEAEAPPPPPPPPPPPAADSVEEEEDDEEEEEPEPDDMVEDVKELEEKVEDKIKEADKPKGVEGGQEGGVEGGVVGGVAGGVVGGVLGGELGGVKTFHHSEVRVKSRVMPKYPEQARSMGLGDVNCKVRIFIDEKGVPYDVRFEACPKVFHDSARDAIMKWRWYPAKSEGTKVRAQFVLNIKYKLT